MKLIHTFKSRFGASVLKTLTLHISMRPLDSAVVTLQFQKDA